MDPITECNTIDQDISRLIAFEWSPEMHIDTVHLASGKTISLDSSTGV
jgi:hypothetical protein